MCSASFWGRNVLLIEAIYHVSYAQEPTIAYSIGSSCKFASTAKASGYAVVQLVDPKQAPRRGRGRWSKSRYSETVTKW